jgi:hypothetical protein
MKFTIPFNMCAFLVTANKPQPTPDFGAFVWGYRINSPVLWIGIYKALHHEGVRNYHTIELLDGGRIDVDGIATIPDQFLPYVVARNNKVYRVQRVDGDTITTTRGNQLSFDEVQPVLYHAYDEAKEHCVDDPERPLEPELPNRVREEGV